MGARQQMAASAASTSSGSGTVTIISSTSVELRNRIRDSVARRLLDLAVEHAVHDGRDMVSDGDIEASLEQAFKVAKAEVFPEKTTQGRS
jgi:histone H3/H4